MYTEQFRLTVIKCDSLGKFISIPDHSSELLILALSNNWVQSAAPDDRNFLILFLFYCSKFWVEYCVLATRDSIVLAYLPGAGNGIESWYWWR